MSCLNFNHSFTYDFSNKTILQIRDLNKLLTLDIELSLACNYNCKYCYTSAGQKGENELSLTELQQLVDQAKYVGVQTIIIIGGGEPLLYPHMKEIISYIFAKQINIVLFTNGSLIDISMANFLLQHDVFPVIKVNGINPQTINWLCGKEDAYKYFIRALSNLESAGYTKQNNRIGISTIICRQNYSEIVPLWKWVRDSNFIPYFERVSPQGRASENDLQISADDLKNLFEELSEIDRTHYHIVWESSHPPIAGASCNRHYYSVYIRANGDVIPCSGIDYVIGNIRTASLQDIISNSQELQQLRHIDETIKGKCKTCESKSLCYGCRGNAYQLTKDFLAEDPYCWKPDRGIK